MGGQRTSTLGNFQYGALFVAFSTILYYWLSSVWLGGIYKYFVVSI